MPYNTALLNALLGGTFMPSLPGNDQKGGGPTGPPQKKKVSGGFGGFADLFGPHAGKRAGGFASGLRDLLAERSGKAQGKQNGLGGPSLRDSVKDGKLDFTKLLSGQLRGLGTHDDFLAQFDNQQQGQQQWNLLHQLAGGKVGSLADAMKMQRFSALANVFGGNPLDVLQPLFGQGRLGLAMNRPKGEQPARPEQPPDVGIPPGVTPPSAGHEFNTPSHNTLPQMDALQSLFSPFDMFGGMNAYGGGLFPSQFRRFLNGGVF